ncbi:hypothetical protein [Microbulbifer sp. TYP-18]|uniref:hypothetical protein n=1 Tax=Microbulbifer sp. TYP-18 TaxID=3230024 RepID=UPI0034C6C473
MRFKVVFLFLFSTSAWATEVKLECTISGKNFSREDTKEYQITFDDNEQRICTVYPCKRASTYKMNETISYAGYDNEKVSNTVETWSKDIIEFRSRLGGSTGEYTLDRTSGTLSNVYINRKFEVRVNMKGPCKLVKKFANEQQRKF